MATPFTLLSPNTNNPASRSLEDDEAAKAGMEFVKSSKGKKASGKGQKQKKPPQRGMGVAQLERLRIQERWKKMTGTTVQFPPDPVKVKGKTSNIVPVLQGVGVANYAAAVNPMMINGGNGGLWGWGCSTDSTAGLVNIPRVNVGNGGFGGFNGGFQKMRYKGENVNFDGGFNKFGQVLPIKGSTEYVHGFNLENNQNIIKEEMNNNGFTPTPKVVRTAAAAYAGQNQIDINEAVEVSVIHRKGNTMGNGSVVMEYELFPGKSSRSTSSKEWERLPAQASVAVGDDHEASYVNPSNGVDLSLKLSYN
ncbi:Plant transcription factor NOZZLE [Corchorus capsularis]|uniref:Plant transcription factor NOZZLE n=1 Tax=Corchorus capsularis TaxID=210143 RepID=A0A1R3ICY7_COCAP|nr:Plant transcription factor NOZZLE [Corchorus capsularis]